MRNALPAWLARALGFVLGALAMALGLVFAAGFFALLTIAVGATLTYVWFQQHRTLRRRPPPGVIEGEYRVVRESSEVFVREVEKPSPRR